MSVISRRLLRVATKIAELKTSPAAEIPTLSEMSPPAVGGAVSGSLRPHAPAHSNDVISIADCDSGQHGMAAAASSKSQEGKLTPLSLISLLG
jgi:hypothetical protein